MCGLRGALSPAPVPGVHSHRILRRCCAEIGLCEAMSCRIPPRSCTFSLRGEHTTPAEMDNIPMAIPRTGRGKGGNRLERAPWHHALAVLERKLAEGGLACRWLVLLLM